MKILMMLLMSVCLFDGMANSQEYRTTGREKFRVIDTSGFYLYSLNKLVQGEKIARPETVYYFSVDGQFSHTGADDGQS